LTNPATSTITNTTSIPTPISTNSNRSLPSGGTGYAPDAAWLAIRRHMQISSFDDQIVGFHCFFCSSVQLIILFKILE
jgi:hypothetical protein